MFFVHSVIFLYNIRVGQKTLKHNRNLWNWKNNSYDMDKIDLQNVIIQILVNILVAGKRLSVQN